jgi:uncharacterized membrane protein YfcA
MISLFTRVSGEPGPGQWSNDEHRAMTGAIVIGLAAGVIAGLLGVGGGVLFVPGLILFLGSRPASRGGNITALSSVVLRYAFAGLMVVVAAQLVRRALGQPATLVTASARASESQASEPAGATRGKRGKGAEKS